MRGDSYTTEEVAKQLKVSKLTVYDLIKKGELPAYRIGRQMRIDVEDLEQYIRRLKTGMPSRQAAVISGQDLSLDILAKHVEKQSPDTAVLRAYNGSLTSLLQLHGNETSIVSLHLFDGDTGEYNIPYVKRILVGKSCIVLHLLSRRVGFYVQKGNPKQIRTWEDLRKKGVRFVNREYGAGIRVLVDENLRLRGIKPSEIQGYDHEESNHIGIASRVAGGRADVGIGTEKVAELVGVEFIPLALEQYDLVILKTAANEEWIQTIKAVLHTKGFQEELEAIGGYDLSQTGRVLYEAF
ncbi:helix-turn-helix transcriptional regulator [Ectobacillus ponti]|uniref:Helix-turn-helix transcriptional regulator n=1 Tax=Ectobacillus ponti TaxID=2961894 RepID=A0AA41X7W6_9BACI|nr:helix-turn-helix transcriptional regulator [Ectobacillus ponti]MCP8967965.1 helix-turn-helix transcriptional regulator [Ectobacillus ponti]